MEKTIFGKIIDGEIPCSKVYEDEKVLAFLDIYPDSKYHTLVIPKNPSTNIYDIAQEDLHAVMSAIIHITKLYKEKLGIEHVQISSNNGIHAQQEIFHSHRHIIPRAEHDGLDIRRKKHPELQEQFSEMLEALQ